MTIPFEVQAKDGLIGQVVCFCEDGTLLFGNIAHL